VVWTKKLADGVRKLGIDPYPSEKLEDWMRGAGFGNV
jgi:hypothetical protein